VGDVIEAVNESVDATRCGGKGGCQDGVQCLTHTLWTDLSERIQHFLDDITIAELMKKQDVQAVSQTQSLQGKERGKSKEITSVMLGDSIKVNCQL
jgi:DNA-binding IscR family transcriptional regulator